MEAYHVLCLQTGDVRFCGCLIHRRSKVYLLGHGGAFDGEEAEVLLRLLEDLFRVSV